MKQLHTGLTIFGMLAMIFCFTTIPSNGDSEELKLEQKADTLLKAGDYERAFKLVDSFILDHPEQPIGRAMLVRIFAVEGQTHKALKELHRFYKLGGTLSEELLFEVLLGALNDDIPYVRQQAAEALEKLGNKRAVPALINRLNDDDRYVRQGAVHALRTLGDTLAVPALINTLNDDDFLVRWGRCRSIGRV